jgi:hypothetical protein
VAVAFIAAASADVTQTATWNVTRPTLSVGDVCLVELSYNNTLAPTWTPPTGFVELGTNQFNSNQRIRVFRKVWDGTEASPLVFAASQSVAGAYATIAYSGVDTTTPEDTTTTTYNAGSATTTPTQSSQTTVTDNAMVVGFWSQRDYTGAGAAGGGATERIDHPRGVTNSFLYIEELVKTPAGAVALTFTTSSQDNWQGVQVALRPAPSGLTPPYVSVSVA